MPDVLVRDLDVAVIDQLKSRAREENRSLQAEMKSILSHAAQHSSKRIRLERARRIRNSIANRQQTDSAVLLREDRAR